VAIRRIYDENTELHEPRRLARRHEAIPQAAADLLKHLPPDFVFSAIRSVSRALPAGLKCRLVAAFGVG